ncbi:hypothetical protein Tco_0185485 [Tanacetum coccineum]
MQCRYSFAKSDLFADTSFDSDVGGSLLVGSVPVKKNCSYITLLVRLSRDIKVMEGLSRCAEPQRSYNFRGWEEAMICRRSIIGDYRMAKETNKLCREVVTLVEERSLFLEELDSLPGRRVPEKMAEFLRETQRKDTQRILQLQILGRETELRAREKEHFI